jgi:hypothetical protein
MGVLLHGVALFCFLFAFFDFFFINRTCVTLHTARRFLNPHETFGLSNVLLMFFFFQFIKLNCLLKQAV